MTLLLPVETPEAKGDDPKSRRIHEVFREAWAEGRKSGSGRIWAYRSLTVSINVFDFTVSRHRDGRHDFLVAGGFVGKPSADCYSGYQRIRRLRTLRGAAVLTALSFLGLCSFARAQEDVSLRMLNGFNSEPELKQFRVGVKIELVKEHVTEGSKAARVTFPANRPFAGFGIPRDDPMMSGWKGYDSLVFDVFNPNDKTIRVTMRIDDDKSSSSDWTSYYCDNFYAFPGANHFEVPIPKLRTPQLSSGHYRKLNVDRLRLMSLWIGAKEDTVLYFDNFSLRKAGKLALPESVRAFQFGKAGTTAFPGFTLVTLETRYSDETGYGFTDVRGLRATDSGLGAAVVDYGVYGPGAALTFAVKLKNGRYKVWCAAGSGEYPKRPFTVACNGREVFRCQPVAGGDFLKGLDFVGQEFTKRGKTLWEILIEGDYFDQFTSKVDVTGNRLEVTLEGDYGTGAGGGVRGLIVYAAGDARAEDVGEQLRAAQKEKFLKTWREIKPAEIPEPPEFTAEEKQRGFMVVYRHYCERITPYFVPKAVDRLRELSIAATPSESEPAVFTLYPINDVSTVEVSVSNLQGEKGIIPSDRIHVDWVHYRCNRMPNNTWKVVPMHLVPRHAVALEKDLPRQFWLTVKVPPTARAGHYRATVSVSGPEGKATFPLKLEVYPFTLPSVADCGLIYAHLYSARRTRAELLADMKCLAEHNCNSVTPSGVIRGERLVNGRLSCDYSMLDALMEVMKEVGMTGPVPLIDMSIQGEGGGHSYPHMWGFQLAPFNYKVTDRGYRDMLTELTRQLIGRAEEKHYLPLLMYPSTEISNDETLGPEYNRKLIQAIRRAGNVQVVSSVNSPRDLASAKDLDHVMVNQGFRLTEERLGQVRKGGAKLWFQNIGQTRYTDGFLMLKAGAIGRRQWKVNPGGYNNHYNGFTGSGDYALLFPSPECSLPTVALKSMSEGADDYRYATKLARVIWAAQQAGSEKVKQAAAEARTDYDAILAACYVGPEGEESNGRCRTIEGFEDKETFDRFRRTIAQHIIKLQGLLDESTGRTSVNSTDTHSRRSVESSGPSRRVVPTDESSR